MDAPQRDLFIWKREHERSLIVELLSVEPYMHRPNSKERGQAWKEIADRLNALGTPAFRVTGRAVRNKFGKLMENFRKNEATEKRASGIEGTEYDEVYQGLTEISSRVEEAKAGWAEASSNDAEKKKKEKEQAEDMRLKATERMVETQRRKDVSTGTADVTPRRKRKAAGDMYHLVEEGVKIRRETKEHELQLRERDLEERKLTREMFREVIESQQAFFARMQEQQQNLMLKMQEQNLQCVSIMQQCVKAITDKQGK